LIRSVLWWAFLFIFLFNVTSEVTAGIIAYFAQANALYYVLTSIVGLIILTPFAGSLFEAFAANSEGIREQNSVVT